jgi:chaperonin cofactor prefoldin
MAKKSETAAVDPGLAGMRKRAEFNEMRARELESQARILEARLHLADMQKRIRERFPVGEKLPPK